MLSLNEEDRRAVDLLLNRHVAGPGNGDGGNGGDSATAAPATQDLFGQRLQCVERWLNLLHQLPADDPPADLAGRTLRRLDEVRKSPAFGSYPAAINPTRPTA